jgi:hypothetical protein
VKPYQVVPPSRVVNTKTSTADAVAVSVGAVAAGKSTDCRPRYSVTRSTSILNDLNGHRVCCARCRRITEGKRSVLSQGVAEGVTSLHSLTVVALLVDVTAAVGLVIAVGFELSSDSLVGSECLDYVQLSSIDIVTLDCDTNICIIKQCSIKTLNCHPNISSIQKVGIISLYISTNDSRPKLVRAVAALSKSDRLFVTRRYLASA